MANAGTVSSIVVIIIIRIGFLLVLLPYVALFSDVNSVLLEPMSRTTMMTTAGGGVLSYVIVVVVLVVVAIIIVLGTYRVYRFI